MSPSYVKGLKSIDSGVTTNSEGWYLAVVLDCGSIYDVTALKAFEGTSLQFENLQTRRGCNLYILTSLRNIGRVIEKINIGTSNWPRR